MNKPTQEISSHLLTHLGGALASCQTLITFYGSNLGPHIAAHEGAVRTDFLPSTPQISIFASKATLPGSPRTVAGAGGPLVSGPLSWAGREGKRRFPGPEQGSPSAWVSKKKCFPISPRSKTSQVKASDSQGKAWATVGAQSRSIKSNYK